MKLVPTLVLLFGATAVFAQSLDPERTITIPLGPGPGEVAVEKGEGEDWKPLFFGVDSTGNVHIPDFYNGRIAIFSSAGRLIRSLVVREGISPRMNFFSLAATGGYVTWDNNSLYLLDGDGRVKWKHEFGFGVIPERVISLDSGIFVSVPATKDASQGCIVFGYAGPTILGTFGMNTPEGRLPMVSGPDGQPFTLSLSAMRRLPGVSPGTYTGLSDAALLSIAADASSLWVEHSREADTIVLFTASGELLGTGRIVFPPGDVSNGFWTCADADLAIYKNYYADETLSIVKYRLRAAEERGSE